MPEEKKPWVSIYIDEDGKPGFNVWDINEFKRNPSIPERLYIHDTRSGNEESYEYEIKLVRTKKQLNWTSRILEADRLEEEAGTKKEN